MLGLRTLTCAQRLALLVVGQLGCGRLGFTAESLGDGPPQDHADDGPVVPGTRLSFGETGVETYAGVTTDATLRSSNATFNFGAETVVKLDNAPLTLGLLRFDLSAIPRGSRPVTAELHLHVSDDPCVAGATSEIVRVTEPWTEGTEDGAVGAVNWNERQAGIAWSGPGAAPPSRGLAVLGSLVPETVNTTYIVSLAPAGLAVIEDWIADPSTNFGFAFPPPTTSGWTFMSSERAAVDQRPRLVLRF